MIISTSNTTLEVLSLHPRVSRDQSFLICFAVTQSDSMQKNDTNSKLYVLLIIYPYAPSLSLFLSLSLSLSLSIYIS